MNKYIKLLPLFFLSLSVFSQDIKQDAFRLEKEAIIMQSTRIPIQSETHHSLRNPNRINKRQKQELQKEHVYLHKVDSFLNIQISIVPAKQQDSLSFLKNKSILKDETIFLEKRLIPENIRVEVKRSKEDTLADFLKN